MARILVVDDESLARFSLREILEDAGHSVLEAANGVEAQATLDDHAVDLIITDLLMPEKEGIELTREVVARTPAMPVIAISGGGRAHRTGFLDVAEHFGARATLRKPFTPEEVRAEVARCLPASSS